MRMAPPGVRWSARASSRSVIALFYLAVGEDRLSRGGDAGQRELGAAR